MIAAHDPDQPGWPARSGRSEAYVDALVEIGVPLRDKLIRDVDWGGTNAAAAMDDILDGTDPPTAVYTHGDELALGVLRSLHRRGLRVPEDVSVVGIDDHPLAELTDLTAVGQPVREQGASRARAPPESSSTPSIPRPPTCPQGGDRPHHPGGARHHSSPRRQHELPW